MSFKQKVALMTVLAMIQLPCAGYTAEEDKDLAMIAAEQERSAEDERLGKINPLLKDSISTEHTKETDKDIKERQKKLKQTRKEKEKDNERKLKKTDNNHKTQTDSETIIIDPNEPSPPNNQQPVTPSTNQQPVTPSTNQQPVTPPTNQQPVTPPTNQRPITPPTNQRPVTSPTNQQPITPPTNQRPITPPTNQQPITPPTNQQPITPPTNQQPITPPTNQQPVTPPTNQQPVTPPTNQQPITPPTNQQPVTPPTNQQPVTPPTNQQPVTSPTNQRQFTPPTTSTRQTVPKVERTLTPTPKPVETVAMPDQKVIYSNFVEVSRAMKFTPLYMPRKSGYEITSIYAGQGVVELNYGRRWEPTVSLSVRTYKRADGEAPQDISGVTDVKWRVDTSTGTTLYIAKVSDNEQVAAWAVGHYTFSAHAKNLSFAGFHSLVADELIELSTHYYIDL